MIVALSPVDYAECLSVLRQSFATVADEFGITAQNAPTNAAFWGDGAVAAVVARGFEPFGDRDASVLRGCAFVGPSGEARNWSLRHLAVLPAARHQGIGASLVAEAVRRAGVGGANTLTAGIVADNLRLAAWYRDLGFVTVEAGRSYPNLPFRVDQLALTL